ncbi:TPA: hypothetical protein KDY92_004281 [Vibrio alginolyticus]|nr:hypothetical protein [Vibrio alginolyticus]
MQMSDWISLGSSVGALVAALIALISLFELIRQRKSSYKPDIAILPSKFTIEHKSESGASPLFWSDIDSNDTGFRKLRAVNVGLGVAKDVNVKWRFNVSSLYDQVAKSMPNDSPLSARLELTGDEIGLKKSGFSESLPLTSEPENELPYLIPTSIAKDECFINIPASYEALVSLWVSSKVRQDAVWDFCEIEPLELQISFYDLGKTKHMHKFVLKPKFESCMRNADDEMMYFKLEFSFGNYA